MQCKKPTLSLEMQESAKDDKSNHVAHFMQGFWQKLNCNIKTVQETDTAETLNLITSIFCTMCPSLTEGPLSEELREYGVNQARSFCLGKTKCWNAHTPLDLRRQVFNQLGELNYLPMPCNNAQQAYQQQEPVGGGSHTTNLFMGGCAQGHQCRLAHSQNEVLYHPLTYRTLKCAQSRAKCKSSLCPYYHSSFERRSPPTESSASNISPASKSKDKQRSLKDKHQKQMTQSGGHPSDFQGRHSALKPEEFKPTINASVDTPKGSSKSRSSKKKKNKGRESISESTNTQVSSHSKESGSVSIGIRTNTSPSPTRKDACQFLDLTIFKTQKCQQETSAHNLKRCPYYHDTTKDRRRKLGTYRAEFCQLIQKKKVCPQGDNCTFSHTRVEEFYHPDKYKAKFCACYLNHNTQCEYGDFCAFAHSDQEISIDLIDRFERCADFYMFHHKTVWCPFNEESHQRDQCVFAHNWQDFRRKPSLYQYRQVQCTQWDQSRTISDYKDGCQDGLMCPQSHGWKECEYHPEVYKTRRCPTLKSCFNQHCSHYHSDKDQRQPISAWFKCFPKCRTVNFSSNYYASQLQNKKIYEPSLAGIKSTSFSATSTAHDIWLSRMKHEKGGSKGSQQFKSQKSGTGSSNGNSGRKQSITMSINSNSFVPRQNTSDTASNTSARAQIKTNNLTRQQKKRESNSARNDPSRHFRFSLTGGSGFQNLSSNDEREESSQGSFILRTSQFSEGEEPFSSKELEEINQQADKSQQNKKQVKIERSQSNFFEQQPKVPRKTLKGQGEDKQEKQVQVDPSMYLRAFPNSEVYGQQIKTNTAAEEEKEKVRVVHPNTLKRNSDTTNPNQVKRHSDTTNSSQMYLSNSQQSCEKSISADSNLAAHLPSQYRQDSHASKFLGFPTFAQGPNRSRPSIFREITEDFACKEVNSGSSTPSSDEGKALFERINNVLELDQMTERYQNSRTDLNK